MMKTVCTAIIAIALVCSFAYRYWSRVYLNPEKCFRIAWEEIGITALKSIILWCAIFL